MNNKEKETIVPAVNQCLKDLINLNKKVTSIEYNLFTTYAFLAILFIFFILLTVVELRGCF
jgi:hypothetical protein